MSTDDEVPETTPGKKTFRLDSRGVSLRTLAEVFMKSFLLFALFFMALNAVAPAQSSTSPEDLLTSGQAKQDKKDYEGALADYELAIRLRPDLAAAYFRHGRVLAHQGKSNAAISDFSKALELDPNMTDALAARASLLLTPRQDFAASIADYDKLINLGVDLDQSYYHRGVAKARLRDFQGAIADYTTVLELPLRETPNYKA
ncbi:MAG: tetratricopeptide repeat protein, partial [Pyrinomonadaceae bacterium]